MCVFLYQSICVRVFIYQPICLCGLYDSLCVCACACACVCVCVFMEISICFQGVYEGVVTVICLKCHSHQSAITGRNAQWEYLSRSTATASV